MKILFFVQFFYPSTEVGAKRPSEMAKYFIAHGHQVDVLCAEPNASWRGEQRAAFGHARFTQVPVPPDLISALWHRLKRLFGKRADDRSSASGALGTNGRPSIPQGSPRQISAARRWYFSFESLYCGLKMWMLRLLRPAISVVRSTEYDVVINSCPPMNTALVLWWVKSFAKSRFLWVIDLRDPFITPSNRTNNSRFRAWLEQWAERVCLKGCDLILVSTPGLRSHVVSRISGVENKIHVIYNGYDGEPSLAAEGAHMPERSALRLLSAGTIYFARDPRPLLDAMRLAIENNNLPKSAFHLTLLGNCENPTPEQLRQMIQDRDLVNAVELRAAVPPHEVAGFMKQADVLVNFAQGQHALVPAKTYEYMASGKETLTITEPDSETAQVVRQTCAGPIALPNAEELSQVLTSLYERYVEQRSGFSPDRRAIAEFSRSHQNERVLTLLAQATRKRELVRAHNEEPA